MFAKLDLHWVKEGQMERFRSEIVNNTQLAKQAGGLVSRFTLTSQTDPSKVTTFTLFESEEAMNKFSQLMRASYTNRPPGTTSALTKMEPDNYEAFQEI